MNLTILFIDLSAYWLYDHHQPAITSSFLLFIRNQRQKEILLCGVFSLLFFFFCFCLFVCVFSVCLFAVFFFFCLVLGSQETGKKQNLRPICFARKKKHTVCKCFCLSKATSLLYLRLTSTQQTSRRMQFQLGVVFCHTDTCKMDLKCF